MSISSTTNRNDYTGNGATSVYAYSFKIFANTDLLVTVRDTADAETTLVLTTDYTVSDVGEDSGGNVTLVNSSQAWLDGDGDLLSDFTLTIRRVRPLTQTTDIRNQGSYFPETHEDAFDHHLMVDQQQQDEIDRAMTLPETIVSSDFDPTIPTDITTSSADKFLKVNAAGTGWEIATLSESPIEVTSSDANKVVIVDSTGSGFRFSDYVVREATVSTTDATVTTLLTIAITASTTYFIDATIVARRTGGSSGTADDGAVYRVRAAYNTVTGTVTLINVVDPDFTAESQSGWAATLTISGSNVLVRVTGAANNNVSWRVAAQISTVAS